MNKENKYYTPTIEEFYVGFEYEVAGEWEEKDQEPKKIWIYRIYEQGDLLDLYYNYNPDFDSVTFNKTKLRVKYLDQKDIESLGYEFISETITNEKSHLFFKTDRRTLTLFSDYTVAITHYPYTVQFHGKIKNKSELIKILKQVNINE
jgi:hypothetical protein